MIQEVAELALLNILLKYMIIKRTKVWLYVYYYVFTSEMF